jgi:RHS repeat-associated protein
MMPIAGQEASQREACHTSGLLGWTEEAGPRNPQASYYRARYYDQSIGRFVSEDPSGFSAGINYYRYVRNDVVNFRDPAGLYDLQGFSPTDAAQMTIAIGQLWAKLKSEPCCTGNPSLRAELLDMLQPGNYGSGVTIVYQHTIPGDPGETVCGASSRWDRLNNRFRIARAELDGACGGCGLAGTILHEMAHLTKKGQQTSTPEGFAYDVSFNCFGSKCDRPSGYTKP